MRAFGWAVLALALLLVVALPVVFAQEVIDVVAYDAWLLASSEDGTAQLYLTLENRGDQPVTLVAIEAHDDELEVQIDGEDTVWTIEPEAALRIAPDGLPVTVVARDGGTLPETGAVFAVTLSVPQTETVMLDVAALTVEQAPDDAGEVIVYGGWARPTALEAGDDDRPDVISGAYLTLENRGEEPAVLIGVTSPRAGIIELHETRHEDGIARMRPVETIDVDAGSRVVFEPGGLHLMLMDLPVHLLPGDVVPLTLHFESGAELVTGIFVHDEGAHDESAHHDAHAH
ncbi:MAG: copper chaperone PCu(A)C [Chloroflexota bacterium]